MRGLILSFTPMETVEDLDTQIATLQARKDALLASAAQVQAAAQAQAATEGDKIEILGKTRTHRGTVYPGQSTGMFAQFGTSSTGKKTIHITGRYGNWKDVDITFTEGETAVYDSFNFDYLGEIVKISNKTVTISPQYGGERNKQLDLATFANRNYDFSLEKSEERRRNWSD
jgi:hypothetical protein